MSVVDDSESNGGFDYGTIEGGLMVFKLLLFLFQLFKLELDPSLGSGYRAVYEREVPFEVRNNPASAEGRQSGTLELIKVKILMLGSESAPLAIHLEMSSEADLFFHYSHKIDEKDFLAIQEKQKLMIDFHDYAMVLIRMLNSCIKEPHVHLIIFTMLNEIDARLDFIQNMEYKFVELMYCVCVRSSDEVIQHHITYRYNAMKQKLAVANARLVEINNLVKIKNPSLLLQLQKTSGNNTSSSSGSGGAHKHSK